MIKGCLAESDCGPKNGSLGDRLRRPARHRPRGESGSRARQSRSTGPRQRSHRALTSTRHPRQNRLSKVRGKETTMTWTKPEFIELRFGFEVTMYIWNR